MAMTAGSTASTSDAIVGMTPTGTITSLNPAAEELYGYRAEEMVGRPGSQLADHDFEELEALLLARATAGEHSGTITTRRRHKSGSVVDVSVTVSPILDAAGQLVAIVSASRDIGGSIIARERFDKLFASSGQAVLCTDQAGMITVVNDHAEQMLGYQRGELIGRPIRTVIPERARTQPWAWGSSAESIPGETHSVVQHKDGRRLPTLVRLHSIEVGGVIVITAVLRNAADQESADAALAESESYLRQLADNVDVAFILRNLNPPSFLYVNAGYQKIYGYDPMATGEGPISFMERIYPEDQERVRREYWELGKEGLAAETEYRMLQPDGSVRWFHTRTWPIVNPDGSRTRSAATVEDITARKFAEAASSAAHLEAEKANTAKNEFLSRMSHELRTPLNAVLGFAQLMEIDELTENQREAVRHILHGGRHLLELIDDVLDIVQIESDRIDMSMATVPIAALLIETIELMRPVAHTADVELHHQLDQADGLSVTADIRRLRQVVLNLISNAVKYNRRGGRVDIRCEQPSDADLEESGLDIVVADTGRGIRPQDMHRLFTPFDRLGAEATAIVGTGVGLALSRRLMAAMGGTLSATSTHGVGTTFRAHLPMAGAVPARPVGSTMDPAARTEVPPEPSNNQISTLIYIEDNHSNIQLMGRLVARRSRWRMVVAGHGALGLELAMTSSPDLVLLDLHLPDMDGVEVLTRLRADPRTCALRVVVVSADANQHQIDRVLAAGADSYLTKPLNVANLLELLDSAGRPG